MAMMPGQPMMPPQPGGTVPGAAPAGGANPLAALAGMGAGGGSAGGGIPQGMQQFLTFLAGMGFKHFQETINKLRNPQGSGGHKSALGKEAAGNPQQTQIPAQMLAQLAARRAQMGGAPAGMPQANPALAGLMGR